MFVVGRKSSCVREVERLRKIREERRAKHADKMAQRKEVSSVSIMVESSVCYVYRNMIPVIPSGSFCE